MRLAGLAEIYVDEEVDTVSVLDAGTLTRTAAVPAGRGPHNVQVSPDGKLAWVTNNGEEPKQWEQEHGEMPKREHVTVGNPRELWAIDITTDRVADRTRVITRQSLRLAPGLLLAFQGREGHGGIPRQVRDLDPVGRDFRSHALVRWDGARRRASPWRPV
jgi:YVTN family beta-propeller protein